MSDDFYAYVVALAEDYARLNRERQTVKVRRVSGEIAPGYESRHVEVEIRNPGAPPPGEAP